MSLAQLTRWWDSGWLRLGPRKGRAGGRARPRASFRPQVQGLEERCLLCTVTNLDDRGPGSLRQCIIDTPTTGTVDFADGLSGIITLTSAPLTVNKFLHIIGPGADVITVSGNHARQVFIIPSPWTVTISGLTIANGSVGGNNPGGGIFNSGALTITGCTFSGNGSSGGGGGAIFNSGNLSIAGSTFSGNFTGVFSQGGGIYNTGTLAVTSSAFSGNSSDRGGGIDNSGTLSVTNSTFSGNNANGANSTNGGGIYNTGGLTITNSIFSSNYAGTFGGGIYNTGNLTITNSSLSGNSAFGGEGGGIINGGLLTVTNSTFSGNSAASNGGAISNGSSRAINSTITSSTFNLNAAANGAAVSHTGSDTLTLTNSTLSDNRASNQGGGIYHSGTGRMITRNTIVAKNRAGALMMPAPDVLGALVSQGYNLIGDGTGVSGGFTDTDQVGTADMPIEPLLGSLQDNGGPTVGVPDDPMALETMAVLPGSPALNAGDPDELGNPDQRGVARSGGVNIGAYQASATAFDVAARASAVAGAPFDVTVTAVDPFGQVAIGYTGTVTFSSADPYGATLPADYTFQPSDAGTVTFAGGATLYTAGTWDVTVADHDSGISGSATVTITPAPAVAFQVIAPASAISRTPFDVTLIATDPYGNTDTNYQGTVTWTSTDHAPGVVLPPRYTFQPSNAGQVTFSGGVTLITVGNQVITATDTTSGINGSATVTVSSAGPGFPNNEQRARNQLAIMLAAPGTSSIQLTAAVVPPVLESATGGGSRLESADVNRGLPAEPERNRPVIAYRSNLSFIDALVPSIGDSFPIHTVGAVDAIFAQVNREIGGRCSLFTEQLSK